MKKKIYEITYRIDESGVYCVKASNRKKALAYFDTVPLEELRNRASAPEVEAVEDEDIRLLPASAGWDGEAP